MDIKNQYSNYIMDTYGRTGISLLKGNGALAIDDNGKEYIDFGSGIGANSIGFADKDWAMAVGAQAHILQHSSNYYFNMPCGEFAEKLSKLTGYQKIFFANSGAEANECAIKIARKYSYDKYGKGRGTIITLTGSFHGRTLATLTATGQESFHDYFFPFPDGFKYAKINSIDDLKNKIDNTVCAIMFEYIQGEGGVIPLDKKFVKEIFQIAEEQDILTIADEVQSGVGRTGKFLAGEHYGKKANITTLAKGLGGGLPIGVCLADDRCKDVLTKGTHGSTFGGNPIVTAGGLTVLNKVGNPDFLSQVSEKGDLIRMKLQSINEIDNISGMGLMLGITLKTRNAVDVMKECNENGLLTLTAKDKLRLLPPLNISHDQIKKGLDILKKILI